MSRRDGKTEKATGRRRSEARRSGQIARSQEIPVAASLFAATATMWVVGGPAFATLRDETALLFANLPSTPERLGALSGGLARIGVATLLPFVVVGVIVTLAVQVAQVGPTFKPKAAALKLSRLSPKQGLERLRPSKSLWEVGRTAVKLGLLVAVVAGPVRDWSEELAGAVPLGVGLQRTGDLAATVLLRSAALAAVVAAADYLWQRRTVARDMRMSKDEVRREHRENEGDPLLRSRRRQRAAELSRNRMLRDVAGADVVVTNPTHLAVALRYRQGDPAPAVVAKGADHLAGKIRAIAYRHGVQVIEDKPLARALHQQVRVGGRVPSVLFEAVAVVLATAYRRSGRVLA